MGVILVLGSSHDQVYPLLVQRLRESGHPFQVVDEDNPHGYSVFYDEAQGRRLYRVVGHDCKGTQEVGALLVRHAMARTLDPQRITQLRKLQGALNQMLLFANCPIANRPSNAYCSYAKPYQLRMLAEAGLRVPRTLVTNIREEAHRFYDECNEQVICKGVSNILTLALVLQAKQFTRLDFLPHSPTLLQEHIEGMDYRVHVIGDEAYVTRLVSPSENYGYGLETEDQDILMEAATFPPKIIEMCVAVTRQLGLIVSGISFRETRHGDLIALKLNPCPNFSVYESRSGQPISRAIVDYLIQHQITGSNVFA
jgi:glutathione synthase/RimK-type ligase-like ATP-grasp enzyme